MPRTTEKLRKELEEWKSTAANAGEKLKQQDEVLTKLLDRPRLYATVLSADNGTAKVALENKNVYEIKVLPEYVSGIQKGDTVCLHPESLCITAKAKPSGTGIIATISDVHDGKVEVSVGNEQKIIDSIISDLKVGDMVRVDPSYNIALEKVGSRHKDFLLEDVPEVPWQKIRGLDYAIENLREVIEYPHSHRELYKKYHKRIPKGVLLYGPPGCGKTLLAKAVAYNISKISGEKSNNGNGKGHFLNINGPEILNEYVGVSERTVRNLFNLARDGSNGNGYPTTIFIDEADAILQKRGSGISSDINNTIVAQFLAELDGIESGNHYVLILATNRPDMIDPAILRPGRIDKKVKIDRPDKRATQDIFELYLTDMPFYTGKAVKMPKGNEVIHYATKAAERIYDPDKKIEVTGENGKKIPLLYQDIVSGAAIESIVHRSTNEAIKREMKGADSGLRLKDIYQAIDMEYLENRDIAKSLTSDDINRIAARGYDSGIHRFYSSV